MDAFRLNGLLTDTYVLMRRHGLSAYLYFLAAGILLTTAVALFDPQALRRQTTGTPAPDSGDGLVELVLLAPSSYLSSMLFTCVMSIAFLRIWDIEMGPDAYRAPRGQSMRDNLVMLLILQTIADMVFTLSLLSIMPMAALVAALTMGLLPAVLVEGRAWDAIGRAIQIAWPRLLLLALIWFFIIVPWVISILVFAPAGADLVGASDLRIWIAAIGSDLVAPVFSAIGLCFTIAAYRQAIDAENGNTGRDISDIFR